MTTIDVRTGVRSAREVQPEEADGGKAIRPTLVLLSAHAVGGGLAAGVPAAVAVELVHNFSLMHDDVMGGDATRRHRPTAWRVFGRNAAILAGDALLMLALDVLASSGHPAAMDGIRMLSATVQDLVAGQSAAHCTPSSSWSSANGWPSARRVP